MPRRNLWLLASLAALCVVCALKVNRYGRVFAFAMDEVRRRFVREVDEQLLLEGALGGMLQQLKDEPSTYLPPEDYSGIDEDLKQEFGGVGIEFVLDPDTQQITVAMTIPGRRPRKPASVRTTESSRSTAREPKVFIWRACGASSRDQSGSKSSSPSSMRGNRSPWISASCGEDSH